MTAAKLSFSEKIKLLGSAFIVTALGLTIAYWTTIITGIRYVSGDIFDGRIMMVTLEHWFNVFNLVESPIRTKYFYPYNWTISYNDALFISGTIYSFYRFVGMDPFLSYELTNWTVRSVGPVSTILFCRIYLNMPLKYASLAGLLLLVSTNISLRIRHAQIIYANFIPLGLLSFCWLVNYVRGKSNPLKEYVSITAFAAFVFAWAMTAFYSLYVFALFIIIYFIALNALNRSEMNNNISFIMRERSLSIYIILSLTSVVIFVYMIYSQALFNRHTVEQVRLFAGNWIDILNIGPGNIVWSEAISPLYKIIANDDMFESEKSTGFPPGFLLGIIFSGAYLFFVARAQEGEGNEIIVLRALFISASLILILAFQIYGYANWELFFRFVPGAHAIRVPMRLLLFVTPIFAIMIAYTLFKLASTKIKGRSGHYALLSLCALLIAEHVRTNAPLLIDRHTEMAFLRSIPPPPPECKSFFVTEARLEKTGIDLIDVYYLHSVDAMLIAQVLRIPTVNGIASFLPIGWNLVGSAAPDYRERVASYAASRGISEGLCALNLRLRQWESRVH